LVNSSDFENMNELTTLGWIAPNFGFNIIPLDVSQPHLGELCLHGPCVGLGYYNDPERTSNAFVPDPNALYHARMYKTGDLVEVSSNGQLYFKGRVDNQIKHMGYRIELEEIEAAYASLPEVDEVGVVYQKISAELGQIVAFIQINAQASSPELVLEKVKLIVPSYMVPRVQHVLSSLPKNQNGKIDRVQLKNML
jgi:D-alanine--poly(phosphoribitol) ligase subunit 1